MILDRQWLPYFAFHGFLSSPITLLLSTGKIPLIYHPPPPKHSFDLRKAIRKLRPPSLEITHGNKIGYDMKTAALLEQTIISDYGDAGFAECSPLCSASVAAVNLSFLRRQPQH